MRYFFVFFIFAAQSVSAQIILPPLLQTKNLKPVAIEFERKNKTKIETEFTSFVIKDLRPDTTTAGYVKFTPEYTKYRRLEFENGIGSVTSFLNDHFKTDQVNDSLGLIILLKNFFITQDYKSPSGISLGNVIYVSKVFTSARLIVQEHNNFYYLGDVDTVVSIKKWLGKCYNDLAQEALQNIVEKAVYLMNTHSAKEINYNGFITTSYPPVFDTNNLKEGIYKTYIDFLNKKPLDISFHFEQRKKIRVLKPLSDSDSAIINNSWGLVDKGILYVSNNGVYIPLNASFGSFSGLGMDYVEVTKVPLTGALTANPIMFMADMADIAANGPIAKGEYYKLFKLNFETGKLE